MSQTITISGQRIAFNVPTDYQTMFLAEIWDGDKIAVDRQKHSDFLCLLIEVLAPTFPKKLYKKTASGYWWLGTAAEFGDLWIQLETICRESFPQYFDMNESPQQTTDLEKEAISPSTKELPELTIEEMRAELEALRKLAVAA